MENEEWFILLNHVSNIDLLKRWIDEDVKNRKMRILSKKIKNEGVELWITTIIVFKKIREEESCIYEGVGLSKFSKELSIDEAARSIRNKYNLVSWKKKEEKPKEMKIYEDEKDNYHRRQRFGFSTKKTKNCLFIHKYMNSAFSENKSPPIFFDDDEEDSIEKRLWTNLSEEKKIEILDRQLDDYFADKK